MLYRDTVLSLLSQLGRPRVYVTNGSRRLGTISFLIPECRVPPNLNRKKRFYRWHPHFPMPWLR
jgi:hypothetical protein